MSRKVISIIFYVIAGFFVYMTSLLAFVNMGSLPSASKPPVWVKFAMVGGFSIPAIIALLIGLLISRLRHWKRDIGIVMVSGAGTTAFVVLSVACVLLSPEFKKLFPDNKLAFFSDFVTGLSCILLFTVTGIALIKSSGREVSNPPLPPTDPLTS